MRYEISERPDWRSIDGNSQLQISAYHLLSANEPDSAIIIPEGQPSWLRVAKSDLEAVRSLGGRMVEELRSAENFDRIIPVLDTLFESGLLFVDGKTGVRVRPTSSGGEIRAGKPKALLLKMTGACNIACDYCYDYDSERWRSRLDMDMARRLIRESLGPSHSLTIMFHGGEPLLHFAEMRELVEFAENEARDQQAAVTFSVQTNGLLLTKPVIEFFSEHPFGVGVSMDGPEHVHDLHRIDHKGRGTFARLREKFDEFPEFMRKYVGYITVVTDRNLPFLEDSWSFFKEQQVLTWKLLPSEPEGRALGHQEGPAYISKFIAFLDKRVEEIIAGRTEPPFILNITQLIAPLISRERKNMCMKMRCGAGDELLVLDSQGMLRGCDCTYHPAFLLDRDDSAQSVTTTAFASPSNQAFFRRARWLVEEAECGTCPWLHFCSGTCPARALVRKGTIFAVDDLECLTRKQLFPRLLSDITGPESNLAAYYHAFSNQNRVELANDLPF